MKPKRSAANYLPEKRSLKSLREAAARCRGCDLYKAATQTVFGEGKARAKIMFIGEQPGDSEDRAGHPFVGPAGKLLRRAMVEADIDPDGVYITNAVKHFKFIVRGKRRIHQTPRVIELQACRPWLDAEVKQVKPDVIVALGATAAKTLFGSDFRLTMHRGETILSSPWAPNIIATVHPSAILRARDDQTRHREMAKFIADLKRVAAV
ncbi:MAG: UdgX family uracil-DNA binding protein [Candidatus Eremiobacteraeota bacterium]|nr:UdgX family uracil-DNA binding protein [Candidatus Eremiobacteraeota bacterium]MBV9737441.1 UdgX family uracil-DNA binding protein [Candidatus Eremiobacteraeota bacterium]